MASATKQIVGEAHFFEENLNPERIRRLLNAPDKEVKDKLEGMKYLLAMMTKGRNMSSFMPDVVKNVIAKSVEVKKLVYMYLVHYADFSPEARELALLSINSFQKDMHATNQRAWDASLSPPRRPRPSPRALHAHRCGVGTCILHVARQQLAARRAVPVGDRL